MKKLKICQKIINDPTSNQTEIIQTDIVNTNNTELESTNNCVTQVKKITLYFVLSYIFRKLIYYMSIFITECI